MVAFGTSLTKIQMAEQAGYENWLKLCNSCSRHFGIVTEELIARYPRVVGKVRLPSIKFEYLVPILGGYYKNILLDDCLLHLILTRKLGNVFGP